MLFNNFYKRIRFYFAEFFGFVREEDALEVLNPIVEALEKALLALKWQEEKYETKLKKLEEDIEVLRGDLHIVKKSLLLSKARELDLLKKN